jgi:aromatic ring hydroxylase
MPIRTGADYIKALQDGREIWNAGRRIEDVTKHSGFTGTIKTLAALYDKQHELEYRDMMTFERDGERTSYSFLAPRNAEQLALKRRNIEFWSQATFGQMGRFPEFVAELVASACWIERTSSKSTTNNGPRMSEPTIVMSAATIFA